MPGVCVPTILNGQAGACIAYSHRHSIGVIIVPGMASIVDDAVSVTVRPEPFAHRWSVWSERRVGLWCSRGILPHDRQL